MPPTAEAVDTVLVVDDEPPVRKTFQEWLESAHLGVRILAAADAEAALVQANQHAVDLAILDWNLGTGNDGLQLLEDLYLFNPDVVAIMITGFAHQATPLDAMRMGVRDYLDKNQDLDRETFLHAVRRQLDRIRPAKRERRLHRSLAAFREAVEKTLPLVHNAAVLNDPVPLSEAIRGLFRFLLRSTGAAGGVLFARRYDPAREPAEACRVYDADGSPLRVELVPFARSVAGSAISLGQPSALNDLDKLAIDRAVELQPFERGRHSLLAAPLSVGPGIQVVLELFDKRDGAGQLLANGFTADDHRLMGAATDLGAELLRQSLAERQTNQVLFDAVAAALKASDALMDDVRLGVAPRPEEPPPTAVLEKLREGLASAPGAMADASQTVRLVEAIRVLALRHGPRAVDYCTSLVEKLRTLLDTVTGSDSPLHP